VSTLAIAWSFTPLREWVNPAELLVYINELRTSPLAPLAVGGAFVVATLLMIPLNALILATGVAFGPFPGALYAMIGVVLSAAAGYGSGRALGRDTLRRLASSRVNKLSRTLAKKGILAIAAARLLPVAPFTLVNLVAGASSIRFRHYIIGTVIGNLPGVLVITAVGQGALAALRGWEPTRGAVVIGILGVVALAFAIFLWIRRRDGRDDKPSYPPLLTSDAGIR
jgi:uncharacterized membrane protein YdjX (TVP38/TMEM64 family)